MGVKNFFGTVYSLERVPVELSGAAKAKTTTTKKFKKLIGKVSSSSDEFKV